MSARLWDLCDGFWTVIARFAARRARGCQQRMRRAIGLPPLPEIPADPAE